MAGVGTQRSMARTAAWAEKLYGVLSAVAAEGKPCPPTWNLAAAVGCGDGSVGYLLQKLAGQGRIVVQTKHEPAGMGKVNTFRLVEIVATRQRTVAPVKRAMHGGAGSLRSTGMSAADDRLERAKDFLRSKGPVVFDNSVVAGGPKGLAIRVDGHLYSPAEVIALAVARGFPDHPHLRTVR